METQYLQIWENSKNNVEHRIECWKTVLEDYGLKINNEEMTEMKISRNQNDDWNSKLAGIKLTKSGKIYISRNSDKFKWENTD